MFRTKKESLLSLLLVMFPATFGEFKQFSFEEVSACDTMNDLKSRGCLEDKGSSRSLFDCMAMCGNDESCPGVVTQGNGSCLYLKLCSDRLYFKNCENGRPRLSTTRKVCRNKGKFSKDPGFTCQCKHGWIGTYCQTRGRNCFDLRTAGYKMGKHKVELEINGTLRRAWCRTNEKINFLVLTSNGAFNRTLSWLEYRNGYTLDKFNYWAGLNQMHLFTQNYPMSHNQLEIAMSLKQPNASWSHYLLVQLYENFTVSDEAHGYSFNYASKRKYIDAFPNLGDDLEAGFCLQDEHRNIPFSTWDHDRDGDPNVNCAERAMSGWWFNGCSPMTCNPLGRSLQFWQSGPPSAYFAWPAIDNIIKKEKYSDVTYNLQLYLRYHYIPT